MTDHDATPDPAAVTDEDEAHRLAMLAVERLGGTRKIYRNPRHPFSIEPSRDVVVDGRTVEIRWGEVSSPAIASVGGWVFQINDEDIDLLVRPSRRRS